MQISTRHAALVLVPAALLLLFLSFPSNPVDEESLQVDTTIQTASTSPHDKLVVFAVSENTTLAALAPVVARAWLRVADTKSIVLLCGNHWDTSPRLRVIKQEIQAVPDVTVVRVPGRSGGSRAMLSKTAGLYAALLPLHHKAWLGTTDVTVLPLQAAPYGPPSGGEEEQRNHVVVYSTGVADGAATGGEVVFRGEHVRRLSSHYVGARVGTWREMLTKAEESVASTSVPVESGAALAALVLGIAEGSESWSFSRLERCLVAGSTAQQAHEYLLSYYVGACSTCHVQQVTSRGQLGVNDAVTVPLVKSLEGATLSGSRSFVGVELVWRRVLSLVSGMFSEEDVSGLTRYRMALVEAGLSDSKVLEAETCDLDDQVVLTSLRRGSTLLSEAEAEKDRDTVTASAAECPAHCSWEFVSYTSSEYEKAWMHMEGADTYQFRACKSDPRFPEWNRRWLEYSEEHQTSSCVTSGVLGTSDVSTPAKVAPSSITEDREVFSVFEYECSCSVGGRPAARRVVPIEPLVGPLRSPRACGGGSAIGDKRYMIVDEWGAGVGRDRVRQGEDQGPTKNFLFDAGASTFGSGKGGASQSWFFETYRERCVDFDWYMGWEPTPIKPHAFWSQIPDGIRQIYHYINTYCSPNLEDGLNPLNAIDKHTRKEDFVVFKLDIDTPSVELPVVQEILDNPDIAAKIDEFFFEHHVKFAPMEAIWLSKNCAGTFQQSIEMFLKLRNLGVRAHSWV